MRVETADGHRARAAALVLWDDADLHDRARRERILDDVLLAAIVVDLLA